MGPQPDLARGVFRYRLSDGQLIAQHQHRERARPGGGTQADNVPVTINPDGETVVTYAVHYSWGGLRPKYLSFRTKRGVRSPALASGNRFLIGSVCPGLGGESAFVLRLGISSRERHP